MNALVGVLITLLLGAAGYIFWFMRRGPKPVEVPPERPLPQVTKHEDVVQEIRNNAASTNLADYLNSRIRAANARGAKTPGGSNKS